MKKITSLILLIFLVASVSSAMAENEDTFVASEKNSISTLSAIGIFQASDFSGDSEFVTRGDAAKLFVKMIGIEPSSSVVLPFTDVESSNQNYGYIAAAYSMKMISGTSHNTFSPDEPVTLAQTAKIITSALGYEDLCIASGGYPTGYLGYAQKLDLFDGVSDTDGKVTYAQMSNIILNALKAELMLPVSFGDEIRYEAYENRNLLSENFDIYFETQIVEADRFMSLYDKSGTGDDEVIADSVIYDATAVSGKAPVGQKCVLYYHKDSGSSKRELLYAEPDDEENNVYFLDSEDINYASESKVEYISDEKTKNITVSSDAIFLLNGQLVKSTSGIFNDFDELELIDNSGDNKADVVHVKKYTVIQVKNLSKDSFTVYDKMSRGSFVLDNDNNMNTVFYYNGELTDFYEIEKDCILSILIPKDISDEYTQHVYVSDVFEDAAMDEADTQNGIYVFGGKSYTCVADFKSDPKPGEKYRIYFDASGKIAALENIENIKKYGYLYGIKDGAFGEISVNIFDMSGEWIESVVSDKIIYNGSKISKSDIYSKSELFSGDEIKKQLVEYTVDSSGNITSVTTPRDVSSIRFTEEEYSLINSDTFRLSFSSESARYFNSSGNITFGEKSYLSEDATILVLPEDADDKEKYTVTTPDRLTHNVFYKGVRLYNCNEYACSSLAIVSDNTESYKGSNPLVVSVVSKTLDSNGDEVERVKGYSRTTYEMSYDVAPYLTLDSITGDESPLKPGDVIIPVVNSSDQIISFERIHNAGNPDYGLSESNIYYDYVTITGKVIDSNSDYVVLDYQVDKASLRLYSTSVYVCEPDRNGKYSVRLGSVGDIGVDDDIVVRAYYLRGIVAVVYKK